MRGVIKSERRAPQKAKILTQKAYKYAISAYEVICIYFYAEWCPGYNPNPAHGNYGFEYDKAADIISQLYLKTKGKKGKAIMLKMNCNNDKVLANQFNIWCYPTYKIIKNGEFVENVPFNVDRTTENFLQFVEQFIDNKIDRNPLLVDNNKRKNQTKTEAVLKTELLTPVNYKDVLGGYNYAMIMFYTEWCNASKDALPIYERASLELVKLFPSESPYLNHKKVNGKLFRLNCTYDSKFAKSLDIRRYPTFKLFRNGQNCLEFCWDGTGCGFVEFLTNYIKRVEEK